MKVVNIKKEKCTIYIGRPSIFGNPFIIGKDGNRDEVIKKYRDYVINNPKLLEAIKGLDIDDILGCYCKPLSCHGDIIIEIFNNIK